MKIFVKAKASAKKESIKKIDGINFVIAVKAPPRKGKANAAVIKVLAEYFGVPSSAIRLVVGSSAKQKIFELDILLSAI